HERSARGGEREEPHPGRARGTVAPRGQEEAERCEDRAGRGGGEEQPHGGQTEELGVQAEQEVAPREPERRADRERAEAPPSVIYNPGSLGFPRRVRNRDVRGVRSRG